MALGLSSWMHWRGGRRRCRLCGEAVCPWVFCGGADKMFDEMSMRQKYVDFTTMGSAGLLFDHMPQSSKASLLWGWANEDTMYHRADRLHGTLRAVDALGCLNAKKEGLVASGHSTVVGHALNYQLQCGLDPQLATAAVQGSASVQPVLATERIGLENGIKNHGASEMAKGVASANGSVESGAGAPAICGIMRDALQVLDTLRQRTRHTHTNAAAVPVSSASLEDEDKRRGFP